VTTFTNPAEALHELQHSYHMPEKKPYREVVSDVRMPQMSGFELAARVKKIDPNLTVILMTAFEIQEQELS
jgi:two-component system, NtrC family, response regulator HydG